MWLSLLGLPLQWPLLFDSCNLLLVWLSVILQPRQRYGISDRRNPCFHSSVCSSIREVCVTMDDDWNQITAIMNDLMTVSEDEDDQPGALQWLSLSDAVLSSIMNQLVSHGSTYRLLNVDDGSIIQLSPIRALTTLLHSTLPWWPHQRRRRRNSQTDICLTSSHLDHLDGCLPLRYCARWEMMMERNGTSAAWGGVLRWGEEKKKQWRWWRCRLFVVLCCAVWGGEHGEPRVIQ